MFCSFKTGNPKLISFNFNMSLERTTLDSRVDLRWLFKLKTTMVLLKDQKEMLYWSGVSQMHLLLHKWTKLIKRLMPITPQRMLECIQ